MRSWNSLPELDFGKHTVTPKKTHTHVSKTTNKFGWDRMQGKTEMLKCVDVGSLSGNITNIKSQRKWKHQHSNNTQINTNYKT